MSEERSEVVDGASDLWSAGREFEPFHNLSLFPNLRHVTSLLSTGWLQERIREWFS